MWRKCGAAVSALSGPHGSTLPQPEQLSPPVVLQTSMHTEPDPARFWHSLQGSMAKELAKGTTHLSLADLTHFAAQVEAACMPEHHPIVSAVHDTLHEACLAIGRSQTASHEEVHTKSEWLLQLHDDRAALKEVASAMKALSWQGLASDVVLTELAGGAKRAVPSWPHQSNPAANHLVDIILQIADSGIFYASSCTSVNVWCYQCELCFQCEFVTRFLCFTSMHSLCSQCSDGLNASTSLH